MIGTTVPWNAAWSDESRFAVRNCRYVGGRPAVWQPHAPGSGKPIFAAPHMVRQRRSIAEMRCTVCGEETRPDDRWWFGFGREIEGHFATTEAPLHRACAEHAAIVCPHIREHRPDRLQRFPGGHRVIAAVIGGEWVKRDFGLDINPNHRVVIGHLKLAWPLSEAKAMGILWQHQTSTKSTGKSAGVMPPAPTERRSPQSSDLSQQASAESSEACRDAKSATTRTTGTPQPSESLRPKGCRAGKS